MDLQIMSTKFKKNFYFFNRDVCAFLLIRRKLIIKCQRSNFVALLALIYMIPLALKTIKKAHCR